MENAKGVEQEGSYFNSESANVVCTRQFLSRLVGSRISSLELGSFPLNNR